GEAAARIARADGVPLAIALPQTGSARIEVPVPRHVVIPGTVQAFDLVQGVRHAATIATERGIAHLQWPQSAAAPQGPVLVWLAGDPPA
ncbi:MAG TPA: hypothetical protein VM491_19720, partial [Burkholderiaceae bacterium]|nr:hypothetical protein [Burkholderiaceae bacterium]